MALAAKGKEVMLGGFETEATKVGLYYDDAGTMTEKTGSGYARQNITWTYDDTTPGAEILNADEVLGQDYVATFDVPAGSIDFVVFLNAGGDIVAIHALGEYSEEYGSPGVYELLEASMEVE